MKKILSYALTLIMLLNLLVVGMIPTYADETNLNDHLVIHYDFKGATVAEALTDKATAGAVKDDLVAYTATNKNTYTADPETGAITFNGTPDAVDSDNFKNSFNVDPVKGPATNIARGASLQSPNSVDTQKIYTENGATWFLRFKIEDVDRAAEMTGGETRVLDLRLTGNNGYCMFAVTVGADGKFYTQMARNNSKRNTYTYSTVLQGIVKDDTYVNFALVMEKGSAEGYNDAISLTPYFSVGEPASAGDWVALTPAPNSPYMINGLTTNPLSMFDRWDCANVNDSNNNYGLTIDDVRLYDTKLTLDQIATIVPAAVAAGDFDVVPPSGGNDDTPAGGNNDTSAGGNDDTPAGGNNDTPAGGNDNTPSGGNETNAPETKAPETNAPDNTKKSGCASSVGVGSVLLIGALGGVVLIKKKETK